VVIVRLRIGREGSRWPVSAGVLFLVIALAVAGWWGYQTDQDRRELNITLRGTTSPNRIDVAATILRVDPSTRQAQVRVQMTAEGTLADRDVPGVPAKTIDLFTTSASRAMLTYPAATPPAEQTINVPLASGWPTDYPQDRYTLTLGFSARGGDGQAVPVDVNVGSFDSLFELYAPEAADAEASATVLNLTARHTRGGWLLAWFLMIAAWALAIVVAGAAWFLITERRGLVWPGFGWMAATLFALVSLRNAAPGSPPIGSLIDYMAFFWAELIVAASLVAAVMTGLFAERAAKRASRDTATSA
jgi:Domain of unknown function (DUF4436)